MRLASHLLIAATLLLTAAPIAMADSIELTVNSTLLANVSSPNDNYWGGLYNVPPIVGFGSPLINSYVSTPFTDISVLVPEGSFITSAVVSITVQTTTIQSGTGVLVVEEYYGGETDPSIPSVAPVFFPGGVDALVEDVFYNDVPIINGNEVSTDIQDIGLHIGGEIFPNGWSGGTNWAGNIGGYGQVDIPYTVNLDVTYWASPVPEPSSIVLLGTGILGLAGIARRKILSQS